MSTTGRLFCLILLGSLIGCSQSIQLPDDIEIENYRAVRIATRSTADIDYPLTVYAFSNTGALVQKVSIDSSDEELMMSLLKGHYMLVAMAGTEGLLTGNGAIVRWYRNPKFNPKSTPGTRATTPGGLIPN